MNAMARSLLRTIVVIFAAIALAAIPLGPGFAPVKAMHAPMGAGLSPDCCPDGKPCDKGMSDCGSMSGCLAKCSSVTGAVSATVTFALNVSSLERITVPGSRAPASPQAPPAPPPRL
jgi:hypothetical protein